MTAEASAEGQAVHDAHPIVALHEGAISGGSLTWHTHVVLAAEDAGHAVRIPLGVPLDEGVSVVATPSVREVTEGGRVVAFTLDPSWESADIVTRQALPNVHGDVHLAAPLLADAVPQIVDVSGDQGVRFEPGAGLGLERHVGFFAPPGLSEGARADAERLVAPFRHRAGDPVYLRMNGPLAAHGLSGHLSTSADRSRAGAFGAAAVFVLVVVALVIAFRKLARAARAEEAEAMLAAEFARMDQEGGADVSADPAT